MTMEGLCCFMTFGDSIDDKLRTGIDITTDEDIRISSLISELVGKRIISMPESDFGVFQQIAPDNALSDSEDDMTARNGLRDRFIVFRIEFLCFRINDLDTFL